MKSSKGAPVREGRRLLLTFNGRRFDVPFLLSEMPELEMQCMHADLLYPTRLIGIRGGLKSVEAQLGIARSEEVQGQDIITKYGCNLRQGVQKSDGEMI
ncbi:ribonuclease H-like domain-containing protein [Methermicoccus shengliensis]|uniref:YprB ribonuclease H-like domain-containing protein n=1 Tax=Methermicoccus shengliensis TaxID=660064 RepID=A0A832RXC1_9EURY|nr:ribonuclease H-like domain-containing protein [Methermicoccus shengliensis]KUK05043.1 MAG: Uncharacterized protein XD46_0036 [Euryarchaeota archaeon 55_53]KUK30253.1 MAG: Uncharacterized protein XD62_0692 [Methanosarcinales archeaon 56_1174]MDI3487573.1 uncharacterized protein [Methanosarcinales archaeon]MDN5294722.1 uncharacterized protein [Methanosarcinales archaeon]HIH69434.1 hypothetical protein [Methermicoccus shengliensis]